jgi:hypothetical protein
VECAARRGRAGRYPRAVGTHGQTYQRRISYRSLDTADQHHDAGARSCRAICVASAGVIATASDRAIAVTAPGFDRGTCAGGGQKACAKTAARRVRAGTAGARGAGDSSSRARARSRGRKRLTLSKAIAGR